MEFAHNSSGVERFWCKFQQYKKDEVRFKFKFDPHSTSDTREVNSYDMRENLPVIFMDAHREVERHLRHSRWALFGRILHRLNAELSDEEKRELQCKFEESLELLKTFEFRRFEKELFSAFRDQIGHANKSAELEFKAFDPIDYYKNINLFVRDGLRSISLAESGDGLRNMTIIALFRAYANAFRSAAALAIEEPELYLHPHAKRGLSKLFRELAQRGSQIFYTTHSSSFVNIEHFDEICLVERKVDDEGDLCTQLRQVPATKFQDIRKEFLGLDSVTVHSIRARYHNLCSLEHSEAFFARKIVLVEGESEEYALPIYAAALDYDFDTYGISMVNARGKTNLDSFYQLYRMFEIPVYLIFDSDSGKKPKDFKTSHDYNEILLRMLEETPIREPNGRITQTYAISNPDFEAEVCSSTEDSMYSNLRSEALLKVGTRSKAIQARYIASQLVERGKIPDYARKIISAIQQLNA